MHRRRVMGESIRYVGLDVHKERTVAAFVQGDGAVVECGSVETSEAGIAALARKLARGGWTLRFCYEAGPCGYGVHRWLSALGYHCSVVAPSLIPRQRGDRIKTDRR